MQHSAWKVQGRYRNTKERDSVPAKVCVRKEEPYGRRTGSTRLWAVLNTATYNGVTLGTQNDDGYVLDGTYQGEEVRASDAYGMTLVEAIYRGLNWRLRFRGLEFNRAGMLTAIQAFGASGNTQTTFTPTLANIGDRYSTFAKSLVLTAVLGSYPPTMPATLTALSAIVAPQSNVQYLMTSKVREAPFEMVLLPYSSVISSSNNISTSFTTT